MGPQIVFDKSALQGLSQAELSAVHRFYYVVYAPVLFMEILGDLRKFSDPDDCKREVAKIADKFSPIDSIFSANYRDLIWGNLRGYTVGMDGRPTVLNGQQIVASTGERGMFVDEEPERIALRRWNSGEFTEAEHVLADQWRSSTRGIDLTGFRDQNRAFPQFKSMDEVMKLSALGSDADERQQANLEWVMTDVGLNPENRDTVLRRWRYLGRPHLQKFAPYAYYCVRVISAFAVGLVSGVIPPKSTNRIDMEYAFYLPFCRVFCSEDKFLKSFVPCFLRPDQDFIGGVAFKAEMTALSTPLPPRGSYPSEQMAPFTHEVWQKHNMPNEVEERVPMSEAAKKKVFEKLKPMLDAIEAAQRESGATLLESPEEPRLTLVNKAPAFPMPQ